MHLFSEWLIQYYSFIYNPYNESSITEEFINFYVLWNLWSSYNCDELMWRWSYMNHNFLNFSLSLSKSYINRDFTWKGQRRTFLLASLSNSNKIPCIKKINNNNNKNKNLALKVGEPRLDVRRGKIYKRQIHTSTWDQSKFYWKKNYVI